MQDIKNGQIVHNSRTGDNGKVTGTKRVWNGRYSQTKLVVDVLGETKLWAYSSCKVIEAEAPRCLVSLATIIGKGKEHLQSIKDQMSREYSSERLQAVAQYILEDDCVSNYLGNASRFQRSIDTQEFARVIIWLTFEYDSGRIEPDDFGGKDHLISELFNLYFEKKTG